MKHVTLQQQQGAPTNTSIAGHTVSGWWGCKRVCAMRARGCDAAGEAIAVQVCPDKKNISAAPSNLQKSVRRSSAEV